jgi:transcriptional regulator with XRE-family HTH domain
MIIGARLRQLREQKGLTQADIEKRTGLMKCYISRVENGHKVPSIENLERFAQALDISLQQLFHERENPSIPRRSNRRKPLERLAADVHSLSPPEDFIFKISRIVDRIAEHDRDALLVLARKMASR